MDVTNIEFIPTPLTLRWIGQFLDRETHRHPRFPEYEAAAMRTLDRLAAENCPPRPEVDGAIRASKRLHGMTALLSEHLSY